MAAGRQPKPGSTGTKWTPSTGCPDAATWWRAALPDGNVRPQPGTVECVVCGCWVSPGPPLPKCPNCGVTKPGDRVRVVGPNPHDLPTTGTVTRVSDDGTFCAVKYDGSDATVDEHGYMDPKHDGWDWCSVAELRPATS